MEETLHFQQKSPINIRALRTALWLASLIFSQSVMSADNKEMELRENAVIYWDQAMAPIGHFLLVQKGKDVCAIRFTEHHRGHDSSPPTLFSSGEETLYAEYDWFYQGDGSGDFTKSNAASVVRRI